jgi:hypothetical protein
MSYYTKQLYLINQVKLILHIFITMRRSNKLDYLN